ncbi:hypothetical protein EVAR_11224_1 [Eumeta japonica]|uniref:Uncharacterized protein n=1 Tax=Eumeta variegata TaxID=151549 RepID=A0A4C2A1D0_EUMVA|nr:hypothetical protein EVAR_11224_1 [Eumeta japonica]
MTCNVGGVQNEDKKEHATTHAASPGARDLVMNLSNPPPWAILPRVGGATLRLKGRYDGGYLPPKPNAVNRHEIRSRHA